MNTKIKPLPRLTVALAAVALFSPVFAETAPKSPAMPRAESNANSNLSHSDKKFLENASKSGVKEVTISQDVLPKLSDPKIRDFAQMMVNDHSAANSQLVELASRNGVTVPTSNQKIDRKWSEKTKDVDEDYIKQMVDDHEEAVDLFEKAAKSDNADIAAFAQKTLPSLQQHLVLAKQLKKSVK